MEEEQVSQGQPASQTTSQAQSESGMESIPRRRRVSSLMEIKNQLLDQLTARLAKFRESPFIRSSSLSAPSRTDSSLAYNQVISSEVPKMAVRLNIDPVRRDQLIENEIEILKKEEADLAHRLDEVNSLLTQMERIDRKIRDRESEQTTNKAEEMRGFINSMNEEIETVSVRKDKVDEQLQMAIYLRGLLKKQLKEITKRRNELKENLAAYTKELETLNKRLRKGSERYRKELAALEQSIYTRRRDDEAMLEHYRANERMIASALEERTVVRKSLVERKLLEKTLKTLPIEQLEQFEAELGSDEQQQEAEQGMEQGMEQEIEQETENLGEVESLEGEESSGLDDAEQLQETLVSAE